MTKFDYEEETQLHIAYYNRGKKEERERILKLIDEKIQNLEIERNNPPKDIIPTLQTITWYALIASIEDEYKKLKEELRK